jgi:hypothetical protein
VFEHILSSYEQRVATYADVNYNAAEDAPEDHLEINLRAAWVKANTYYQKLDRSPAYYTATLLHPYYKNYCEVSWADHPEWLAAANAQFQALWAEYNTVPRQSRRLAATNNMDDAIDSLTAPGNSYDNLDEFERWHKSEPRAAKGSEAANNPIKYWVGLRDRYPNLSKLALDVLSIPASSCECERMFSELGHLLEPRRRGLRPELLAAIQCVRTWLRAGFGDVNSDAEAILTDEEIERLYELSCNGESYLYIDICSYSSRAQWKWQPISSVAAYHPCLAPRLIKILGCSRV